MEPPRYGCVQSAVSTQDAAWLTGTGGYSRGRDEIKRLHVEIHQTFYKNTHMQTIAVEDVTFLTPAVAVHARPRKHDG